MTGSLLVTVLVEGLIVLAYGLWRKKPAGSLLLTSIAANLITQSMLWVVLNIFLAHYLTALWITEVFIWLIESAILRLVRSNRLGWKEALLLSLGMNLASFGLGWFLAV